MSNNIWCAENYINVTADSHYGNTDPYETCYESPGKLFKAVRKEYGRCISKIYIDTPEGKKSVGWVFVKRAKYDDSKETYLQETWVTLYKSPRVKVTREVEYLEI